MNASRTMGGRAAIATAIAMFAMLVGAPAASAAFSLENLSATPASPAAGANSDFSISLDVEDANADLKDLTIHLPPGLVGNPLATPNLQRG